MTSAEKAIRSVRDCGTLGVREPARNAALEALEALATKGLVAVRLKRIGLSWWRVYSLVRP